MYYYTDMFQNVFTSCLQTTYFELSEDLVLKNKSALKPLYSIFQSLL